MLTLTALGLLASGCSSLKTMILINKGSHAVCVAYLTEPTEDEKCVSLDPGDKTEFRFVDDRSGEFHIEQNEKKKPKVFVLPKGEPRSKIVKGKEHAEFDGSNFILIAPKRFFFF